MTKERLSNLQKVLNELYEKPELHTNQIKRLEAIENELIEKLANGDNMEEIKTRDSNWLAKAEACFEVSQKRKYYENLEESLLTELKEMSKNISSAAGKYKFVCFEKSGSIDYKSIPQLKGVDLDKYRKPGSVCWKLSDDYINLE